MNIHKKYIFLLLLPFVAIQSMACNCKKVKNIDLDCKKSTNIFIGRVISQSDSLFDFEVIKIWKGKVTENGIIRVIQNHSDCYSNGFFMNEAYMIYEDSLGVNDCSRTALYKDSWDPDRLNEIYAYKIIKQGEFDSIEHCRLNVGNYGLKNVDLKTKKLVFYYDGKFISGTDLPPEQSWSRPNLIYWYWPLPYLIKEDLNECHIDYLIYVKWGHSIRIIDDDTKQKILRKYYKKACH